MIFFLFQTLDYDETLWNFLLKNTGVPERMLDDYEEKVERFVGKFCLQKESLKILVTSEEKKTNIIR